MVSGWREWAQHRFGLRPIWERILNRRVAEASWYFGDGATLVLLLSIQLVTGAALALRYVPSLHDAHESVAFITGQLTWGWFVRGLHYWSGGMMVVMLYFHLFRLILIGSYKLPREGTWFVGVLMFFLIQAMALTGYLLRWDESAIYGVQVIVAMFYRVPVAGEWLASAVQGGSEINATTLSRLYGGHVVILPLLVLMLTAYHLYLVILRGTTSKTERERLVPTVEEQKRVYERDARTESRGDLFYPEAMLKSGAFAGVVFAFVLAMVYINGPPDLQPKANLVESSQPREEWWFWWYGALIALLPRAIVPTFIVVFPLALFVALLLPPILDRGPERGWQNRPLAVAFVTLCVIALLWLSWLRYRSSWTGWPTADLPPPPPGVVLSHDAENGRTLFGSYGCTSCHAVAGKGAHVGSDLARLDRIYSRAELSNYILSPPRNVAMPSYAGRLSAESLDRLVDFVHVVQTSSY